jgi:hypothetical protein
MANVAAALQRTLFRVAFSLLPPRWLRHLVTLRPSQLWFVETSLD